MSFVKAQKVGMFAKVMISGPAHSGKTPSALTLAKGLGSKIALIDLENGKSAFYANSFDYDIMQLEPPFECQKIVEGINEAIFLGYDVVIIDTLSPTWEACLERKDEMDKSNPAGQFTSWRDAGKPNKMMIKFLIDSKIHIIANSRAKVSYVIEKNDKGKNVPVKVGTEPIMREGSEYEFYIHLRLDMDHVAHVEVDSTDGFLKEKSTVKITSELGAGLKEWLGVGKKPDPGSIVKMPVTGYDEFFTNNEEKINGYLLALKFIEEGQTFRNLSADKQMSLLTRKAELTKHLKLQ